MSIRANGSGDRLTVNAALGITTGDFSVAVWAKLITDRDTYSDLFGIQTDDQDPAGSIHLDTLVDGTSVLLYDNVGGGGDSASSYGLTAATWYWIVLARTGNSLTARFFDDTTSTTPLATLTATSSPGGDLSALDWFSIGQTFTGPPIEWCDAEFANAKVHVGVNWTNAQARAESQHTLTQTGGGTWWLAARLTNLSIGLTDNSGAGHHLTNTGCVDGASSPSQLTDDAGGIDYTSLPMPLTLLLRAWA